MTLVLEFALLGGFQRVDDGGFLVALLFLDGGDVEAAVALGAARAALARKHRVDRRDVAVARRRRGDRRHERGAVALGDHGADRPMAAFAAVAAQHRVEQPREQRIGAHDAAVAVDGRDRHRRMVEEAHEADFGGALRIGAVVMGTIEHEGARGARHAVGTEGELVEQPHRQSAAAAGFQIEIEHLGLDLARRGAQRRQQRGAVAGDEVGELEAAGADLRQILIEPVGERGVEVDHVALAVDGEEAGRSVIEIIDGVLQFLKDVFLPLALARHVAERPHGEMAAALAPPPPSGRTRSRSQRAGRPFMPATRTSSCRRVPSRAALSRR